LKNCKSSVKHKAKGSTREGEEKGGDSVMFTKAAEAIAEKIRIS